MTLLLKHKILLLTLGCITAVVVAILVPAAIVLRANLHDIQRERLESEALALAQDLQDGMRHHQETLLNLGRDPVVVTFLRKRYDELLDAAFSTYRDHFPLMAVLTPDGEELYRSLDGRRTVGHEPVADNVLLARALASPGRVVVSEVGRTAGGSLVIHFALAIVSFFDEIQGVLVAQVPLSRLNGSSRIVRLGEKGFVAVVDSRMRLVLSSSRQATLASVEVGDEEGRAILAKAASRQRGFAMADVFGRYSAIAIAPASGLNWTAMAVMPFEEYRRPLHRARALIIPLVAAALLAAAWAAVRASRALTKPLARLSDMAQAMTTGDFTVNAQVETQDEVGDLANSLNLMRNGLLRSHAALEAVVECGRIMLSEQDWSEAVTMSLRSLCLGADTDQAFWCELAVDPRNNVTTLTERARWSREIDTVPDKAAWEGFDPNRWLSLLREGKAVAGPVDDLPKAERRFLSSHGARSILVVGVHCQGMLRGVLGVEDGRTGRDWEYGERKALQAAADILGGAFSRRETLVSLREERDKLDRIAEGGGIGMAVIAPDSRVVWSNRVLDGLCGGTSDAVCRLDGLPGQAIQAGLREVFEHRSRQEDFEFHLDDPAGQGQWFQVTATPVRDDQGATVAASLVFVPVTERKRFEAELVDARKAAEQGNRVKRIFMDTMSHELRTPLTAVLGFSDVLTFMELSGEQRECVDGIKEAGMALLAIIDDILDLVRIESGAERLVPREFSLAGILGSAEATFKGQAQAKGLGLRLEIGTDVPPRVVGHPVRLRQILLKLMDNALKFTAAGQVTLRCQTVPDPEAKPGVVTVRLTVSDTGPGIPDEMLAAIFDRFTQVDGSLSRHFGGVGVGLSIVYNLVERMGGHLDVTSTPGAGSTFAVTFPLGLPERRLYCPPGPPRPTVRVLVVDPSPLLRMHMQLLLDKAGRISVLAESLPQARDQSGEKMVDAVFVDPGAVGDAVSRIRAGEAGPGAAMAPVVALVQDLDPQTEAALVRQGYAGAVKKPASVAALMQVLDRTDVTGSDGPAGALRLS